MECLDIKIPVKGRLENIERFKHLVDDELIRIEFGINIDRCELINDQTLECRCFIDMSEDAVEKLFLIIREMLKELEIYVRSREIIGACSYVSGKMFFRIKNMLLPEISVLFFEDKDIPNKKRVVEMLRNQKRNFCTDISKIDLYVKRVIDEREIVISRNDIYERLNTIRFNDENEELNWNFGFIKVYVDNASTKEIIKSFFDKYTALSDIHDKEIEDIYGDCRFEEFPKRVCESDIHKEKDGFLMNFGELSLLAYGSPVPDVTYYLYDIVNVLDYLVKVFGCIRYEGAVSCRQCLYRPEIQVIGAVRDYSYTMKRILKECGYKGLWDGETIC